MVMDRRAMFALLGFRQDRASVATQFGMRPVYLFCADKVSYVIMACKTTDFADGCLMLI